jgi:GNAT superfamily N-acetyltransferase
MSDVRRSAELPIGEPALAAGSEVQIRRIEGDRFSAVANLLTELGYPATVEQVRQRLAIHHPPETIVLVAAIRERLVGLASFHRIVLIHMDGFLGRVTSLVVTERERGRGIGRRLLAAVEEYAWSNGCLRIEITSGDHRPDTHRFYERVGYKLDSRRHSSGSGRVIHPQRESATSPCRNPTVCSGRSPE